MSGRAAGGYPARSMEEKLRKALAALRAELETLQVDSEAKANLQGLVADVERQLAESEESPDLADHLENLPKLVERFEVEHPRLTRTLNEIMITLGNMGI